MRTSLVLFLLLPTSAMPAQQLWLSRNDNASYGPYAVGWPSSVIAFRFMAQTAATVVAAQVFTGNQSPSPHSLELRLHDGATGLPGALLGAAGTWTSIHARCWQGTTLPQPVPLAAGQDCWLVWRVSGMFPQHSVSDDFHPANVLVETRYSDGSSWHAQAMVAAKFRLFTAHAAGPVTSFGTSKPGTFGAPTIGVSGYASLGSPIDVWLDDAARRVTAVLLLGVPIPGGLPLPLGTLYSTADATIWLSTALHTSPSVGAASHSFFVPNLPAAAGFPLTFQWAVFDPAAAQGLAHSAAVTAVLQ